MIQRAFLVLLLVLAAGPLAADEEAARYFSERGRKALEEEDWAGAREHFEKALSEQEGYLPAVLGLAEAAIGARDTDKAVGYLEACLDREKSGGLTEEERAVVSRAEELLKKLDRPRLDCRRIVDDYVAKLLDLGEKSVKDCPGLARQCASRILKLVPDHAGARELLGKVGPGAAAAPKLAAGETALFNGVDLRNWTGHPDDWKVKAGVLVGESGEGHGVFTRTKTEVAGDYELRAEFRITAVRGKSSAVFLAVGVRGGNERINYEVFEDIFRLARLTGSDTEFEVIEKTPFYQVKGGVDPEVWNTYGIAVEGSKIVCSVNGTEVLAHDFREPGVLSGCIGIVVQDCAAEFRKLTLVK